MENETSDEGDARILNVLTKDGKRATIRFGSALLDEVKEIKHYRCVMVFHAQSNAAEETAAILTTGLFQTPSESSIKLLSPASLLHSDGPRRRRDSDARA